MLLLFVCVCLRVRVRLRVRVFVLLINCCGFLNTFVSAFVCMEVNVALLCVCVTAIICVCLCMILSVTAIMRVCVCVCMTTVHPVRTHYIILLMKVGLDHSTGNVICHKMSSNVKEEMGQN